MFWRHSLSLIFPPTLSHFGPVALEGTTSHPLRPPPLSLNRFLPLPRKLRWQVPFWFTWYSAKRFLAVKRALSEHLLCAHSRRISFFADDAHLESCVLRSLISLEKCQYTLLSMTDHAKLIHYSNSVLTLYGLILAPAFEFDLRLRFLDFGVLTAHLSTKVALECSFKLRFSPKIENGSLNKLRNWSLNNLIETPIL